MGGCLWNVSVAWEIASFCLNSLSIFSSRLFFSFLVYSLISYSSIFEYGRLPVECVGRLGDCLVLPKFTVYLPFSSVLFFLVYSLIFYSNIFEYGRLPVECIGMFFIGVCRGLGRLLSVACGMCRYVFYRCVSVAWEIVLIAV